MSALSRSLYVVAISLMHICVERMERLQTVLLQLAFSCRGGSTILAAGVRSLTTPIPTLTRVEGAPHQDTAVAVFQPRDEVSLGAL